MKYKVDAVIPEDDRPAYVCLTVEKLDPSKSPKTHKLTVEEAEKLAMQLSRGAKILRLAPHIHP
jgi:hypothetical protein